MGKAIGFLGTLRLGDRFISVDRSIERAGAGTLNVFDAPKPVLPTDSPNWHRSYVAHFDKAESGSGPVGQFDLHASIDDFEDYVVETLADELADLIWVGDDDQKAVVVGAVGAGGNVVVTVDDLGPLSLVVGDLVFFSGGAWGVVNLLGAAPPHTLRIALLSGPIANGETAYRAWRVYPDCRVLGVSWGAVPEESMDGFRMDIGLSLDSVTKPVRSVGGV